MAREVGTSTVNRAIEKTGEVLYGPMVRAPRWEQRRPLYCQLRKWLAMIIDEASIGRPSIQLPQPASEPEGNASSGGTFRLAISAECNSIRRVHRQRSRVFLGNISELHAKSVAMRALALQRALEELQQLFSVSCPMVTLGQSADRLLEPQNMHFALGDALLSKLEIY